ncbi:MAG: metalloprotease TldD [Pseudomonadales bacterium]|jgi:TldD protein|nr:metalloprotease TldD [Pseudomonadales bacterium]MDP6470834.1 metalloprotease TldD [Pseudomonadales bacterium]MDP6825981.1 metalloprotease TldD [Pseudomonadales bacterium]MDP6972293.1 metalloprotease TldD [Pseudomonadales bacterium]|tara:strand:+ start:932 stop:2374 length:1443 start_codon:yes stop_codon:yes gene_type:complete
MSSVLDCARDRLWAPAGIDQSDVEKVIDRLAGPAIDMGEVFFQNQKSESWALEDGIVKEGSFSVDRGVGVRAVSGEKTGFAYAEDILLPALGKAADAARTIAGRGDAGSVSAWRRCDAISRYPALDPLPTLSGEDKVALLMRADHAARTADERVDEVNVRLAASHESVLVIATDGTLAGDIRPLVRMDVSVIVEHDGRRERGFAGGGGRRSLVGFDDDWVEELAREAVRTALVNLEADAAPAGPMTVVLGPGWPGVLLHEAVGHGLEGDFNHKGSSAFAGKVGQPVASELCTVVDDGTMDGRRGSLTVDDEGTPSSETVLIEKGVLQGYMQDKLNARLMGTISTGNGRRQSYASLPMPRMTNTYLRPGESDPEEIIASVKKGVFAANFGGGQVDITSGRFVFSATEAYLIEGGKMTRPIRGATLIGNGPEVMGRVSMVGNDLEIDHGVGVCGKDGQSVPVGVGQPTLKIDEVIVGGTSTG